MPKKAKKGKGEIYTATVTTISTVDGKKTELIKKFEGTKAEVQAKIDALHKMDGDHSKMKKNIKKELHKEEKHEEKNHDN